MKRRTHPIDVKRRQAFHAWIKWSPMLVVLFGMFFFDAWLSIETRNNDYELGDLRRQQREILASLELVRVEQAQLESMNVLALRAPDLGLVQPAPDQVVAVLRGEGSGMPGRQSVPMVIARMEWESMAGDVGMLLKSKVPTMARPIWEVADGMSYLDKSMEHLLESF